MSGERRAGHAVAKGPRVSRLIQGFWRLARWDADPGALPTRWRRRLELTREQWFSIRVASTGGPVP